MDSTEKQADKALVKAVNKQHSLHTWSIRAKCFQGSQIWILATFLPLLFVCSWQSCKKLLDMGLWDMTTSAKGRALLCSQPLVPTACQRLLKLMNAGREMLLTPASSHLKVNAVTTHHKLFKPSSCVGAHAPTVQWGEEPSHVLKPLCSQSHTNTNKGHLLRSRYKLSLRLLYSVSTAKAFEQSGLMVC